MISRRVFLNCAMCAVAGPALASRRPRKGRLRLCATEAGTNAEFYPAKDIDWSSFYIADVQQLIGKCFDAFGVRQQLMFCDEAPLQQSFNDIDRDDPGASSINIGVGNLALYPYSTLVAVVLHELGHFYCFRSTSWDRIESYSVKKQMELLADFMAGAAYARMEPLKPRVTERVAGQCSKLDPDWPDPVPEPASNIKRSSGKRRLNPRRLARASGKPEFFVLRDGRVEPVANNALIGTMPEEDPSETKCATIHSRTLDFLSMAAAVSTWRTFGDRPETESHGTPAERYDAFSMGYEMAKGGEDHEPASLATALGVGMNYLRIGR